MHLVIDGYDAARENLEDSGLVYRFLDTLPESIGMTKITKPAVHTHRAPKKEDWGVTGFVIIAESHVSVHTFPERSYVNIDVFSCKDFDTEAALNEIKRFFSLSRVKTWILERGLDYLEPLPAKPLGLQDE